MHSAASSAGKPVGMTVGAGAPAVRPMARNPKRPCKSVTVFSSRRLLSSSAVTWLPPRFLLKGYNRTKVLGAIGGEGVGGREEGVNYRVIQLREEADTQ